jgi:hypothetical protein
MSIAIVRVATSEQNEQSPHEAERTKQASASSDISSGPTNSGHHVHHADLQKNLVVSGPLPSLI